MAAVTIGAPAGEGLLFAATAATALVLLVLEGRYLRGGRQPRVGEPIPSGRVVRAMLGHNVGATEVCA